MGKYAASTEVSSMQSKQEIERTLTRYGARKFMYGWDNDAAVIAFEAHGKQVKFILPLPARNSREIMYTDSGRARSLSAQETAYEQATRQRWRALLLIIKAKLEAIDSGICVFEDEFMSRIVIPGGQTVGDFVRPQIEECYRTGLMPSMLPMLGDGRG